MKHWLFILNILTLVLSVNLNAQDYSRIIEHVNKTPTNVTKSTKELSIFLAKPFEKDQDKYAAFYYWIAKNIVYNKLMAQKPLFYKDKKELVDHVIKRKNGVCQHFSELFVALCNEARLEAYVVGGYTRTNNKVDKLSHSWNIVKVNGEWRFLDATWGGAAQKVINDNEFPRQHFMLLPSENIKIRMPFDPIWQALSKPIKYNEFDNGLVNIKTGGFNFNDSIKVYTALEELEQYEGVLRRMKSNGPFNRLVRIEYEFKKENYQTLKENLQVNNFNNAGKFYNMGLKHYNDYAKIKNQRAKYNKQKKSELLELLDNSMQNLKQSKKMFEEIIPVNSDMKNQIKKSNGVISEVIQILEKEIKYVKANFN